MLPNYVFYTFVCFEKNINFLDIHRIFKIFTCTYLWEHVEYILVIKTVQMYVLKKNMYLFESSRVCNNSIGKPLLLICAGAKSTTQMECFLNTYLIFKNCLSLLFSIGFQNKLHARYCGDKLKTISLGNV